jgi:hypothetical protein
LKNDLMWFMIGFLAIFGNDFDLNFEKNEKKLSH